MRFFQDQRGQSVVIGTIILFGFLIVALSLYQVEIVPTENSEVEFEHSQDVQTQFLQLRNSVNSVATTGSAQSTAITLGTRYPQRTFSINPPPATGTLKTTTPQTVEINGTVASAAHANVKAFWTNKTSGYNTQSIQYTPQYNELRTAGQLTYEQSYVASEVEERVVLLSEQTIVREGQISLSLLTGMISETAIQSTAVDIAPVSQQQRTIPITGDGTAVELRIPTAVGNTTALANRLSIPDATAITPTDDAIIITLPADRTYQLGLGAVSVADASQPAPAYLVPVGGQNVVVNQSVGVEVRDKYNNPVSDANVTLGGETLATNNAGQVFTTANTTGKFNATLPGGTESYEQVVFTVRTAGSSGSGSGGTGSVVGPNITVDPADRNVTLQSGETIGLADRSDGTVTLTGTINNVGNVAQLRSGTPVQAIQYDVVNPTGTQFIAGVTYADFDADTSERAFTFTNATGINSTLIDTSSWPTGTNTLEITAQDASGRLTPETERAVVNVTVEGGGNPLQSVSASATTSGGSGKASFQLENTGNSDAIITGLAINSTTSTATEVSPQGNNPSVISNTTGGLYSGTITIGGPRVQLDQSELVEAGETTEIQFDRFDADVRGTDVVITVYLANGSPKTFTLEYPP